MRQYNRALILSGGGARGAYEIGVWKYLCEMGWKPDLICGTSVGAINGAAIASGLPLHALLELWHSLVRDKIFRVSLWRRFLNFLLRRGFTAYMNTKPLRSFLEAKLDIAALRTSSIELVIAAVNLLTSELVYFDKAAVTIDHIMASSAIPILFPWQYIDGEPYWDGGVMANTPLAPAFENGAREIIVVMLTGLGTARRAPPKNQKEAVELLAEHAQIGALGAFRFSSGRQEDQHGRAMSLLQSTLVPSGTTVAMVAPRMTLGVRSILDFSPRQSEELIAAGYEDARAQLAAFFAERERQLELPCQ